MDLADVKDHSRRLGTWAHLATVNRRGHPTVVPVHPCWVDDELVVFTATFTAKARNIALHPEVALHWQVGEATAFEGLLVHGEARILDDLESRLRYWHALDYDLADFAPDGPHDSEGAAFLLIRPTRALLLREFGFGETDIWERPDA